MSKAGFETLVMEFGEVWKDKTPGQGPAISFVLLPLRRTQGHTRATLQASLPSLPACTPLSLEPWQTAVVVPGANLLPKAQGCSKR